MIEIMDKNKCCGCAACLQCCPKRCISMKEDEEGFLYPYVDKELCIGCNLCNKICPVINPAEPKDPLKVYAAKNKDPQKRKLSSSGGLFIALAEKVIEKGGVVFGAVFDEKWEVHHVSATTMVELEPMMRSKYVQSRIESTFAAAEKYLKEGREVMYTGTSCQIAALKLFLRKEYENLLAVDLICHGAPSPGIWRKYLHDEITQSARSAAVGKNTVLWSLSASKDAYMRAFFSNLILRPSCYSCPAKNGRCHSDITLADYWGIAGINRSFDDDRGVSMVLVNSAKGASVMGGLDILALPTSFKDAVLNNSAYGTSAPMNPLRNFYWQLISQGKSVHEATKKVCHKTLKQKAFETIAKITQLIKRIIRLLKKSQWM